MNSAFDALSTREERGDQRLPPKPPEVLFLQAAVRTAQCRDAGARLGDVRADAGIGIDIISYGSLHSWQVDEANAQGLAQKQASIHAFQVASLAARRDTHGQQLPLLLLSSRWN